MKISKWFWLMIINNTVWLLLCGVFYESELNWLVFIFAPINVAIVAGFCGHMAGKEK